MTQERGSRDTSIMLAATFFYLASTMLVNPIIAGFTGSLGATAAFMGIVSSLMSACSLVMRPIAGNLSDRLGKRWLVTVGAVVMCVTSLLYGAAQTPLQVAVLRLACGAGYSLCSVCMASWYASLLPPRQIGSGMGRFGMMNALGIAVAPALGLAVYEAVGYRPALMLGGVFAGLSVLFIRLVHSDGAPVPVQGEAATGAGDASGGAATGARSVPAEAAGAHRFALLDRRVVPVALIIALFTLPYMATQSFIVNLVEARGLHVSVSLFFPVYAVALFFLRYGLKRAFDTVRFGVFLGISAICSLGALALLTIMQDNLAMFAAAVLMAGGYGVMVSVCQATSVKLVEPEHVGMANSTYYMGFDAGTTLGSVVGGLLFGSVDLGLFFPLLALAIPAALVVYACARKAIEHV